MNGNHLLTEGNQLRRFHSKTGTFNLYLENMSPKNNEYLEEMNYLKSKISNLQRENKSISGYGFNAPYEREHKVQSSNIYKSQTPKARSVSHNYESIIQ